MKSTIYFIGFAFLALGFISCGGDSSKSETWCKNWTVADLLALKGSSPNTFECATVAGKLVYRKSTLCRAGAFYLEDSTGSIFVCDPSVKSADSDSGTVVCPEDVLKKNPQKLDGFEAEVQAEGDYYPSKPICGGTVCWCQNGLVVDQIDEP